MDGADDSIPWRDIGVSVGVLVAAGLVIWVLTIWLPGRKGTKKVEARISITVSAELAEQRFFVRYVRDGKDGSDKPDDDAKNLDFEFVPTGPIWPGGHNLLRLP